MGILAEVADDHRTLDVWSDPAAERIGTPATLITFARTAATIGLGVVAAYQESLGWLLAALAVYWVGDMLDGYVARTLRCETRIGATMDILCDRFCAAMVYFGLIWIQPDLWPAVALYLAEFMVIDLFLSLAFLAWPVRSPNYFYVVDEVLWRWNWSKPAKAVNSALFAVLLLALDRFAGTQVAVGVGVAAAGALCALKVASVARLLRIGIPIPGDGAPAR